MRVIPLLLTGYLFSNLQFPSSTVTPAHLQTDSIQKKIDSIEKFIRSNKPVRGIKIKTDSLEVFAWNKKTDELESILVTHRIVSRHGGQTIFWFKEKRLIKARVNLYRMNNLRFAGSNGSGVYFFSDDTLFSKKESSMPSQDVELLQSRALKYLQKSETVEDTIKK